MRKIYLLRHGHRQDNEKMTEAETNVETMKHQQMVRCFVDMFVVELLKRSREHDKSKTEPPELEWFTEFTSKLAGCTYGSPEYEEFLKELKVALGHHYARNRHHPEHFPDGINGMNLIDLVEMLCDWKAATMRHHDGNILRSLEVNAERFGIHPQLLRILRNTVEHFDMVK